MNKPTITVRGEQPGDMGYIAYRHGVLYAREYGFDLSFDEYVISALARCAQQRNPETDCIWIAECGGEPVGAIGLVGAGPGEAQLRWFLVEPEARGLGVGHRLIQTLLAFCRERGIRRIFLWTLSILPAARHLYEHYGFNLTEEKTHPVWGRILTEERWDLDLEPGAKL